MFNDVDARKYLYLLHSKRHLARQFPRFPGDLLGHGMKRSDLRLQFLPPHGDDPVERALDLVLPIRKIGNTFQP